ncbi:MAG: 2-oxoacid:acceptor oxidoreductase family protein [Candidatus Heimdallarchaeaceae archaeon]
MKENKETVNIAFLGLGGQGIITLAKMIAESALDTGKEVCYNEIHGLSQRGGSVQSFLRLNEDSSPLFASSDVDLVIGLEKMETLRYLYEIKEHKPKVILLDYFEIRNTNYFGLEVFPEEEEIEKEIRERAEELYIFDRDNFKKQFKGNFIPYNVGIFSALTTFEELGISEETGEKIVKKLLGKNILLSQVNKKAFKEGKKWIKKI